MLGPMLNSIESKAGNRIRAALLSMAMLAFAHAVAAHGFAAPHRQHLHPGACLTHAGCVGLWWDERRQPRRPKAPEPASQVESDIWGPAGSPWGYVRRLPPPTPETHIQPRYREASTIRSEFNEPNSPTTP